MIKIAVTGGIGSGKSVVSNILTLLDIPVYNADMESKRLTASSPLIRKTLTERFGDDLYQRDDLHQEWVLNKAKLASLIFSDKEQLMFVNRLIHPIVLQDFIQWTERINTSLSAIESAILFESGFDREVKHVICVTAPTELRIRRAMERDAVGRQQVIQRMESQLPDEYICKQSDFVVYNDDVQAIIPQVEKIIREICP
ncbi:MAG: dephospho-CoA kinase [Dysgonamonadaceae bacterium]|jgi:dephospho-CoA kinase|nr:dephospho-CoA kinase [Dysgonamonadaceae bacterium]